MGCSERFCSTLDVFLYGPRTGIPMTMQSTVDPRRDPPVEWRRCVHTRRPIGIREGKRSIEATYTDKDSDKQTENRRTRVDGWLYWVHGRPGRFWAQVNWGIRLHMTLCEVRLQRVR